MTTLSLRVQSLFLLSFLVVGCDSQDPKYDLPEIPEFEPVQLPEYKYEPVDFPTYESPLTDAFAGHQERLDKVKEAEAELKTLGYVFQENYEYPFKSSPTYKVLVVVMTRDDSVHQKALSSGSVDKAQLHTKLTGFVALVGDLLEERDYLRLIAHRESQSWASKKKLIEEELLKLNAFSELCVQFDDRKAELMTARQSLAETAGYAFTTSGDVDEKELAQISDENGEATTLYDLNPSFYASVPLAERYKDLEHFLESLGKFQVECDYWLSDEARIELKTEHTLGQTFLVEQHVQQAEMNELFEADQILESLGLEYKVVDSVVIWNVPQLISSGAQLSNRDVFLLDLSRLKALYDSLLQNKWLRFSVEPTKPETSFASREKIEDKLILVAALAERIEDCDEWLMVSASKVSEVLVEDEIERLETELRNYSLALHEKVLLGDSLEPFDVRDDAYWYLAYTYNPAGEVTRRSLSYIVNSKLLDPLMESLRALTAELHEIHLRWLEAYPPSTAGRGVPEHIYLNETDFQHVVGRRQFLERFFQH